MARSTFPGRHPSLIRSLQYFEAVARNRSVSAAASELHVSQSAVSHQLRELTQLLGEPLVTRSGRGIMLTPAGERLAARLSDAFTNLHDSVDSVLGAGRPTLRLAVCSSFGPGWLIPRLGGFLAANPDIDLQLRLYAEDPRLSDDVADAIVSAVPMQPGFTALHILNEQLVAVEAPGRRHSRRRLITTDTEPEEPGTDWTRYSAEAGIDLAALRDGLWLRTTHYMMALEMARAGLGAALVPDFIAVPEVERGTLTYLDRARVNSGRTYRLCFKHMRSTEPALLKLVKWFRGEVAATVVPLGAKKKKAGSAAQ